MSIGTGAVLFVIGAILAFAVHVDTGGALNLNTIGWILMVAGVVVFVVGIVLVTMRRRSVTESHTAVDPAAGEQVTRRTTDTTV
jgi:protein-S-isoprenylcysteine O-methyltransferase Ste14